MCCVLRYPVHTLLLPQAHPAAALHVVQDMLHTQFVAPLKAAFPHLQHTLHIVQVGVLVQAGFSEVPHMQRHSGACQGAPAAGSRGNQPVRRARQCDGRTSMGNCRFKSYSTGACERLAVALPVQLQTACTTVPSGHLSYCLLASLGVDPTGCCSVDSCGAWGLPCCGASAVGAGIPRWPDSGPHHL